MWPGDPVTQSFWSEVNIDNAGTANTPSDRRHPMSTGPFTLSAGEEQTVQLAIVWSRGWSNLNSITTLRRDVAQVREQFDANFANRSRFILPPGPKLVTPVDGSVVPQGRLNLTASVPNYAGRVSNRVEIQVTREAFSDTTRVYSNGAFVDLAPGAYQARVRYAAGLERGPWSDVVAFTVSGVTLTPYELRGIGQLRSVGQCERAAGSRPSREPPTSKASQRLNDLRSDG